MAKPLSEIFDSFSSVMALLRQQSFQDLLVNYERAKATFLVGYQIEDTVTSDTLFDSASGLQKPEDYLIAFNQFIHKNANAIDAIAILLNRPSNWNTQALTDLHRNLKENLFEVSQLQNAHHRVHHKESVDIISMVKHAVNKASPLLSVTERVDLAIERISTGKKFNIEQQKWLGYIKEHLKQNMTLDEDDFSDDPVLARRGGLSKFKKTFADDYKIMIQEINQAIAA